MAIRVYNPNTMQWEDAGHGVSPVHVGATPPANKNRLWADTSDSSYTSIPKSLINAKGDLLVGTANDAIARMAAGSDMQELFALASAVSGLQWKTRPSARAYATSFGPIGSGSLTPVTFAGTTHDTDSMWSAAVAGRLTVNTAGVWLLGGHASFSNNGAAGRRALHIHRTSAGALGTDWLAFASDLTPAGFAGSQLDLNTVGIKRMVVGDYFQLVPYQASGANEGFLFTGTTYINMWGVWICP